MAVYTVENGQLKRVAEELEAYAGWEWDSQWGVSDCINSMGFTLWDDAKDVYGQYQRGPGTRSKWLPGIHYLFHVEAHGELMDYILIGDHLPDYLAVMAMLEPLRIRDAELRKEVAAELLPRRRP